MPYKIKEGPGPAACNLINYIDDLSHTGSINKLWEINESKETTFGTSTRRGPEKTTSFVPGPGMYDFFSPFKKVGSSQRMKTSQWL